MTFDIRFDAQALRDIDQFVAYQRDYSEDFALKQIDRLDIVFRRALAQSPLTWGYFFVTGAPYRAYLFRVGRRTQYWIVYTVDLEKRHVDILRFWNARRDTEAFEF
jgi:plasmid stabilization system protein ParE